MFNSTGSGFNLSAILSNYTSAGFNASSLTNATSCNVTDWEAYNMTQYGFNSSSVAGWNTTGYDCRITSAFAAAAVIKTSTLEDFCSTLLGYTAVPDVTTTVAVTTTVEIDSTITSGTLTSGTTQTLTSVTATITITADDQTANQRLRKRQTAVAAVTTPAALQSFSDDTLSTACSWKASQATTAATVTATTTDTAYTTVYITVPATTVPATTDTLTATSTFTVNVCDPTAPSQLMTNPSFECYDEGWDLNYDGAVLYWGPSGNSTTELSAAAAAYVASVNSTGTESGTSNGTDPYASAAATATATTTTQRKVRRQDAGYEGAYPHNDGLYTPNEPAYDGNTYVRLSPVDGADDAGLGQTVTLDAGPYWMSYKYRVPTYALNNDQCTLNVFVSGILVIGPGIADLTDATDGWAAAGGFFTVPDSMAGDNLLWFDFYCPPLAFDKRQSSADEESSLAGTEGNLDPQPTVPLLDLDYIRMGVDDGGWAQYRPSTPSADDASAAEDSADVAAALATTTTTSDDQSSQ